MATAADAAAAAAAAGGDGQRVVIIDNFDSFTYNLYQYITAFTSLPPLVLRNNAVGPDALAEIARCADYCVVSPGPGTPAEPADVGVSLKAFSLDLPVLGVCLGHQALCAVHQATVRPAKQVMHGRLSTVDHTGDDPLFDGIPAAFSVVRYHSLAVDRASLPSCLRPLALARDDGELMAVRHVTKPYWGVQYHPESICSQQGVRLMRNFHTICADLSGRRSRAGSDHDWLDWIDRLGAVPHAPRLVRAPSAAPVAPSVPPAKTTPLHLRYQTIPLDTSLAEAAFLALFRPSRTSFWLDSSRAQPGHARFSFMGDCRGPVSRVLSYSISDAAVTESAPDGRVLARHTSVSNAFVFFRSLLTARFTVLEDPSMPAAALPFDFHGGIVGYFGYECGTAEIYPPASSERGTPGGAPDACFLLVDRFVAFDAEKRTATLVILAEEPALDNAWLRETQHALQDLVTASPNPSAAAAAVAPAVVSEGIVSDGALPVFKLDRPQARYLADIAECQMQIERGESYELCLTNKLRAAKGADRAPVDPVAVYRRLRASNPAPYAALLQFGPDLVVASSSPERFLKIDRNGMVESKPIKGTLPRGKTPEEDRALYNQLKNSTKDFSENLMIVDLIRNDLGIVCESGSVHCPKLMDVESYATVHQLVSTVRGTLRPDMTHVDCVQQAFPPGSMTGAPKRRSIEILHGLERDPRGIYSGTLGMLGFNGSADLCVVIRTAIFSAHETVIGAGGAIIALSDVDNEFDEMILKTKAVVGAVMRTARGEGPPESRLARK